MTLSTSLQPANAALDRVPAALRGAALLRNPHANKFTAFTAVEREELGLTGLLPEQVETEEAQIDRVLRQIDLKTSDLERYIFLTSLLETNETLFYRVLMSDPARFIPLVYTPTVGEACENFGHILRRPRGLYLSINRKEQLKEILRNWTQPDVRFIVVTDGERILGLGDLGVNGMGIPVGKLALYTACAGVPPHLTLPITLDVGTNNESLLADPLYLGLRQRRVTGAQYDEFIEAFVTAVQEVFPRACIQFEDFAFPHAAPVLARYRDRVSCFNDDIQGTAAVVLAGVLAALRVTGGSLADQRFLFLGGGTAGSGIAGLLVKAMVQAGVPEKEAFGSISLFDKDGLIHSGRSGLADFQKPFAHDHAPVDNFVTAIETLRPTAIIGVSTAGKAFSQPVIEAMARVNERPIIFPLSNPTSHSECTAEEAYVWSDGRAVFASGSPFGPVQFKGRTFTPGQGNNVYIFPALGMAIYATEARRVTEEMLVVAAQALAQQVTPADLDAGLIYPPQSRIFETSLAVAREVASFIFDQGLAGVPRPDDLGAFIDAKVYRPSYASTTEAR
ncbi:malate dehydrogenase (oxaloacetate-decarboxylating)(NADP+) [Paraburkholderia sp. EB58]|jgi:malate dehydrogenase (oxaloacetate-decarboxylating)(NADP+)|uniref:NAD-dependent malic enzyme n=1 Tax=Paraburkholderia sp. EB58 TaxID=3035125 RepID=UPI003D1A5791